MFIFDIARSAAGKYAAKPAILSEAGAVTFAEQWDATQALAAGLLANGVSRGDRVAILSTNRVEYAQAYSGVPLAGAILTVLNYRSSAEELVSLLSHCDANVLLVEADLLPRLSEHMVDLPGLELIVVMDEDPAAIEGRTCIRWEDLLASGRGVEVDTTEVDDFDPAWLIYTSGTTGRPKGVLLSHRNVCTALASWLIEVSPARDEVQLLPFPMCHIAGVGVPGYCWRGVTIVLQKAFDAAEFLSAVGEYAISGIPLAPTMLSMLATEQETAQRDLSSVTLIQYGSAPMTPTLLSRAMALFPNSEFTTGFGMTELGANVLWFDAAAHRAAAESAPERLRSVGRPMTLAEVRVVDADMGDVATGEIGELVVRGDQVSRRYWGDPELTAEAWRGGWFHTGDLARLDEEGFVYIVDRIKDMVITGGENVYTREVEDVLAAHPTVAEVAVVGMPDERWGEILTAVVVPVAGTSPDLETLAEFCRQRLAGYKVPRRVVLVDAMPRTTSGKIMKRALREEMANA
ncbi:MAG: class I adenylate-forming enzyme family protein [Marmoricola sp.]